MKEILQNRWLTIFAIVLVVTLTVGCFYELRFQHKQELLLSKGTKGFLERTRSEKLRFSNEKVQRESEKKTEQERDKKEQAVKYVKKWMQGTWVYNGRVHVYGSLYTDMTAKLVIDGNYIVSYGNGEVYDEGTIRDIDMEEQRVTFGSQSYFEFDNESRTIYTGTRQEGTRYRKVSSSSDNRSSHTGSSSSGSTTTFNTSTDVMAYLSNRFKNSAGNVITVKRNCLFSNGNQITNAVRVVRFNGSRATLTATSPYTVGTLYFTVDASRGTFTDGSGDVFYIQ